MPAPGRTPGYSAHISPHEFLPFSPEKLRCKPPDAPGCYCNQTERHSRLSATAPYRCPASLSHPGLRLCGEWVTLSKALGLPGVALCDSVSCKRVGHSSLVLPLQEPFDPPPLPFNPQFRTFPGKTISQLINPCYSVSWKKVCPPSSHSGTHLLTQHSSFFSTTYTLPTLQVLF